MRGLAQLGWHSMLSALCGGAFTLVCVYFSHRLQRSQADREQRKDAQYRLLVVLRQLQVVIATAVDRTKKDCADGSDARQRYDDMVLELALRESTRPLQDAIVNVLRRHDDLPELKDVRRALWCPGAGAERWLASLARAVELVERRVSPKLRAFEGELYAELPEQVRRAIEHPEELWGSKGSSNGDPD
jgi:hypothetical protein